MQPTENISVFSGLSPAGPYFDDHQEYGLSPASADFVDVIHTDMDNYGTNLARGTYDFYPNGGEDQPNCGLDDSKRCSNYIKYSRTL